MSQALAEAGARGPVAAQRVRAGIAHRDRGPPPPGRLTASASSHLPFRARTVQAGKVGDERAEIYLGRLAEAELRRGGGQLRRLDAAAADPWADPGMPLFGIAEDASWKVGRAARILVAAGLLDQDYVHDAGADLGAAIQVRSRLLLNWYRRQGVLHRTIFG